MWFKLMPGHFAIGVLICPALLIIHVNDLNFKQFSYLWTIILKKLKNNCLLFKNTS